MAKTIAMYSSLYCIKKSKFDTLNESMRSDRVSNPGPTGPGFDTQSCHTLSFLPGRVAQSVGHLTRRSGVLGSIPGLATYFRFSFRFFKKGSCQLLAKVCARSTG